MSHVLTIDGPSGAGKGTICQLVADALDWHILDSGSLYRLTALAAFWDGVDMEDEETLENIARSLEVEFIPRDQRLHIMLRGKDVSEDIRTEENGMRASKIAAMTGVRAALLDRQRAFAKAPGLVADGRDMGTGQRCRIASVS